MERSCEMQIRVRYAETDRMGLLHHAQYLVYFEQGRTELLRQRGISYRDLEDAGYFLVVVEAHVKYRRPAYYDDVLTLRTWVHRITVVRIQHRYELYRASELLAEGETTLACVDRQGKLQPLPSVLQATEPITESPQT